MYDIVVEKVYVRYLICWWASCNLQRRIHHLDRWSEFQANDFGILISWMSYKLLQFCKFPSGEASQPRKFCICPVSLNGNAFYFRLVMKQFVIWYHHRHQISCIVTIACVFTSSCFLAGNARNMAYWMFRVVVTDLYKYSSSCRTSYSRRIISCSHR